MVVGGGIAGLTAGLAVLESGATVTVLEGTDRVGGKLRREIVAGHPVDVGAEAMLAVGDQGTGLATAVGLGEQLTTPATSSAGVFSSGRLWPIPSPSLMGIPADPEQAAGLLSEVELDRLRSEVTTGAVDQDSSVAEFVSSRLGLAVLDKLVDPLVSGVYAGDPWQLSLRATAPQLWTVARSGERLLDASARLDRSGGSRARGAFAGLVGGMGTLPEAVANVLRDRGARIVPDTIVRQLNRRTDGGWTVVSGPTTDPKTWAADAVIVAVPPSAAARLLSVNAPTAASALATMDSASMAVVTLAFPAQRLGDLPGSGFLVPAVEQRPIKAATFSSAKWAWLAETAPEVAYVRTSVGRAGSAEELQRPDASLIAASLAELGHVLGRDVPPPIDVHVQRWGGALPQYAVGHVDRVATIRASVAEAGGLAVCGAAYDGVGIPAVVGSARAAAAAVLA